MGRTTTPTTHRKSGFSFTEMMVVMAIIGTAAAGGTLEVVRRRPSADVNRAAWEITAQLRRARTQAIAQNAPCEVRIDTDKKTCTIWTDADGDGTVDEREQHVEDLSDIRGLYLWTWPAPTCRYDARGEFHTRSADYGYQHVYFYVPGAPAKYMWVYGNGQVDLRDE